MRKIIKTILVQMHLFFNEILGLLKTPKALKKTFRLKVGGNQVAANQIIQKINGISIDSEIEEWNPIIGGGEEHEDEIEFINFKQNPNPSSEEVLQEFKRRNLKPPTVEHAIRFAEVKFYSPYPEVRRASMIFLHKPWQHPNGTLNIIGLSGCGSSFFGFWRRCLNIFWLGHIWSPDFYFAAVRPRK